jgi:hypothetical protein
MKQLTSIAVPKHYDADPDPTFHFDADPSYPTFYFGADPDPSPHRSDPHLRPRVTLHDSILSLQASIVSLNGPPKLLSFDFDGDPLPKMIRIRIRYTAIIRNFLSRNDISIEGAATLMINPATALRMIKAGINLGVYYFAIL